MTCPCLTIEKKMKVSIQTALIAFVIFNPLLFKFMGSIFGKWLANSDGLPTMGGLIIHVLLFGFIIYALMRPFKNQRQSVSGLPLV